jgi:hypothetical protein
MTSERLPLTFLCYWVVLLLIQSGFADGQRVDPCFTSPPSCDGIGKELTGLDLYAHYVEGGRGMQVLETCQILDEEYFHFPKVNPWTGDYSSFNIEQDWRVLADIPADSPFCADAREFFNLCPFCIEWYEPCGMMFTENPLSCEDYVGFDDEANKPGTFIHREGICRLLEYDFIYYNASSGISDPLIRQEVLSTMPGFLYVSTWKKE